MSASTHAGHLPSFVSGTDGKGSDIEVARTVRPPRGSIVVADRLYQDFGWLKSLDEKGVVLVTRVKRESSTRFGTVARTPPAGG